MSPPALTESKKEGGPKPAFYGAEEIVWDGDYTADAGIVVAVVANRELTARHVEK